MGIMDILEQIRVFFLTQISKLTGQEVSELGMKISLVEFVLYFFGFVIFVFLVIKASGEISDLFENNKKAREERALRKGLSKQKDEELVKMGEIKYEPLDPDKKSYIGIHLKDRFESPVEQSLSSGYLLFDPNIEGEWLFLDRARRLAPGNSGLLNAIGAWEQYEEGGKITLEYGYFKVEVIPALAGKYYVSCTEGSYLDVLPGERPLRRLLLVRLLDEKFRSEEKCEYFLLEEIVDVFSLGRTLRLWKGNLTIPEDSARIQTIVDQEVETRHPNGSQMIN